MNESRTWIYTLTKLGLWETIEIRSAEFTNSICIRKTGNMIDVDWFNPPKYVNGYTIRLRV